MARGEPPGRQFIKSRPSASTYRPSMAKRYPSSSMPTFGPGGGGAAQARLQQQADQIMPVRDKSETWGRALEQMFGFLTEQDTIDAVERGDISPALGAAIIAASVVPLPVGKTAGAVAKGATKANRR